MIRTVVAAVVACLTVSTAGPVSAARVEPAPRAGERESNTHREGGLKVTYLFADANHRRISVRIHSNAKDWRAVRVIYWKGGPENGHRGPTYKLDPGETMTYQVPMDIPCRSQRKKHDEFVAEAFWYDTRNERGWRPFIGMYQKFRKGC